MRVKVPEYPKGPEKSALWAEMEAKLLCEIAAGLDAEAAIRGLDVATRSIHGTLFDDFLMLESTGYQKVDNYRFLVLHLKGRLLRELRSLLNLTALDGKDADRELTAKLGGGKADDDEPGTN
jgi:hypothetical protein